MVLNLAGIGQSSHDEHGLSLASNGNALAVVWTMLLLVSVLEHR